MQLCCLLCLNLVVDTYNYVQRNDFWGPGEIEKKETKLGPELCYVHTVCVPLMYSVVGKESGILSGSLCP